MKNQLIYKLFLLIILFIYHGICYCQATKSDNEKIEWLKNNVIEIKSVDPNDENYSDLETLKNKILNSRIVLLGEQSHGDGTTFLVKTRLIKFLVKKMGFDVILFESGLFDCKKINDFLKNGESANNVIKKGIFGIWNKSEQFQPLIKFIDQNKNNLEIGGIDCQFTGEASKEFFLEDFESFLKSKNILTSDYPNLDEVKAILRNISEERFLIPAPQPPSVNKQNELLKAIEQINLLLKNLPNDSEINFWIQMLSSTIQQAKNIWQSYGYTNPKEIPLKTKIIRDIQMGENLIWQSQMHYPNKKIIVWAATFHIVRNLQEIEVIGNPNYYNGIITMGDIVRKTLGDQLYTIGFTAYEGTVGYANNQNKRLIEKPEPNSLEDLFFKTGFENCFLDFRKINTEGQWLKQKIISRPLGYTNMNSNWTQNIDGMIFTKNMVPSKMIPEQH